MYTLDWRPAAVADIALIELEFDEDSDAAAACRNAFEQLIVDISATPLLIGVARVSSLHRYVIRWPVSFEFEVVEDDRVVIVHAVSYFGTLPEEDAD